MKVKLGQRVKNLRKSLGLTQKQFASRVPGRLDYTYLGKIERGHQYPSLNLLEKTGRAYDVPLSYFFQGEGEKSRMPTWREEFDRVCVQAASMAALAKRLQAELKKLKEEMTKDV